MTRKKAKGFLLFVFLIVFIAFSAPFLKADTFFGDVRTGLMELDFFNHPVYLFVPEQYTPERALPLVIALPDLGQEPTEYIQAWAGLATRQSFIVIVPTVQPQLDNVPYPVDDWLMKIKKDVTDRYHVAPKRIFLIGEGQGAHYAGYLAVKFPNEFSGAALLNGSWAGPFAKLVTLRSNPDEQVPFFVAFSSDKVQLFEETKRESYRLTEKGYPVHFEVLKPDEEFSSKAFRSNMLEWMTEKSQDWEAIQKETKLPMGEKIRRWVVRQVKVD